METKKGADVEAQRSDPPPSYEASTFSKLQSAKDESNGNIDYGRKVCFIICGSIGCTIAMCAFLAIPIAMIVIGAIHLDDCPAERMIPIYLIVGGSFGILKSIISMVQRCMNRNDEDSDEKNSKPNPVDGIIGCFLLAWFIAGNVWVYRTHNEWSKDSSADNYCDPTVYWFAFWLITASYIIMGVVLCLVCCGILACCCCAAKNAAQGNNLDQQ